MSLIQELAPSVKATAIEQDLDEKKYDDSDDDENSSVDQAAVTTDDKEGDMAVSTKGRRFGCSFSSGMSPRMILGTVKRSPSVAIVPIALMLICIGLGVFGALNVGDTAGILSARTGYGVAAWTHHAYNR